MTPTSVRRTGRAAPMAPDERRRAIVDVVVPLLLQHGDGVTTKQIAEAAGIAEGTIFRVFPDKAALLMAVAEETMNPSTARADLAAALAGCVGLRERVLVTTQRMHERSEKVVAVMMALRGVWMTQAARRARAAPAGSAAVRPGLAPGAARPAHRGVRAASQPSSPWSPRTAALLLRTLVLGARHPGAEHDQMLTPDQITVALLDGIRSHPAAGKD